jgi:5-methylcytosine-specific restriction endonuclease McrA
MPYKDHNKKLENGRQYYQQNRERLRAYNRKRCLTAHFRRRVTIYLSDFSGGFMLLRRMAVRRSCELAISFDEYCDLVRERACSYCGTDLKKKRGHKLDRIDNRRGYTLDNVVPCCARCNNIKGTLERWGYRPPRLLALVSRVRQGKQCLRGHALSGTNLLITKDGDRICLNCKRQSGRETMRRKRARQKAARLPDPRAQQ